MHFIGMTGWLAERGLWTLISGGNLCVILVKVRDAYMKLLLTIIFALLLSGVSHAQLSPDVFRTAQKIKLLNWGREDVRKLFPNYEASFEDSDTFEAPGLEVEISYADGECTDSSDDNDVTEIWRVAAGKAVKVEIEFEDPVQLGLFDFDFSALLREQEDDDDATSYALFSKSQGIMFAVEQGGVKQIILFPPAAKTKSLCPGTKWGKQFYSSDRWFDEFQMGIMRDGNQPPQVDELELSTSSVEATGNKIRVVTSARDPENDPLTYNYTVSGGVIRGRGHSVVWDLAGVPPGIYTITAAVDDGCGNCGRTITKSITIK